MAHRNFRPVRPSLRDATDAAKNVARDAKKKVTNVERSLAGAERKLAPLAVQVATAQSAFNNAVAEANEAHAQMCATIRSAKDEARDLSELRELAETEEDHAELDELKAVLDTEVNEAKQAWSQKCAQVRKAQAALESVKALKAQAEANTEGHKKALESAKNELADADAEVARLAKVRKDVLARRQPQASKPTRQQRVDHARLGPAVVMAPDGTPGPASRRERAIAAK